MNLAPETERLVASASELDLCTSIASMCRQFGFQGGSGFAAWHDSSSNWQFRQFGNVSPEYLSAHTNRDGARQDPVMQYVKHSTLPLTWDRRHYERTGHMDLWEQQAPHGLATGVIAALHLGKGKALCFGLSGFHTHWRDRRQRALILGRFQTFHAHLEDAFTRIIGWPPAAVHSHNAKRLSERELECLKWAAEGKTNWEIGQLLNISERTAKMHLAAAQRELDCVSKTHAVARAIRLQLI